MQEFTNEAIEINSLPRYQEVSLNAPHPTYWKVMLINISIFIFLSITALITIIILNEKIKPYGIYLGGGCIIIFAFIFLLYKTSFKKRGYALREKDIIYKSGIIAEKTTIIPLNRIQHVALDEGLFSRIYKLATLQIHTAGDGTGHMHISGIPIEQARTIKEALLKRLDLLETSVN
ncbi:MAG: PH domain-containing protein [Pedobacter sp.]|nr:PH domain-containing protein [Pedobacter sp.]